jgi:hypothetical protein
MLLLIDPAMISLSVPRKTVDSEVRPEAVSPFLKLNREKRTHIGYA